jgi:hypothetical protein
MQVCHHGSKTQKMTKAQSGESTRGKIEMRDIVVVFGIQMHAKDNEETNTRIE